MRKLTVWMAWVAVVALLGGGLLAGELAEKPEAGAEAPVPPIAEDTEGNPADVVAKVDDVEITRAELNHTRDLMRMTRQGPFPNNQQILEQLINRALWNRHFDKENLRPGGPDIQAAITQLDLRLRQKNSSYDRFLIQRRLTVEEHAGMLAYEIAMRRLIRKIQEESSTMAAASTSSRSSSTPRTPRTTRRSSTRPRRRPRTSTKSSRAARASSWLRRTTPRARPPSAAATAAGGAARAPRWTSR